MPDQPALKTFRRSFGMKLKSQDGFSIAECLVLANRRRGKKFRSLGEIKSIAVPMENRHTLQRFHGTVFALRSEGHRRPANLLSRPWEDPSIQGAGKELGAQANPESGTGKVQSLFDDGDLVCEERVLVFLVC